MRASTTFAESPANGDVRSYLSDMPWDIKAAIVGCSPDAAVLMLGASREWAQIVGSTLLGPVWRHLERSPVRLRAYVVRAMRNGKTPAQIVLLGRHFDELTGASGGEVRKVARHLISLGLLVPRTYNALCQSVLQLLCSERGLVFAFARGTPLFRDDQFRRADLAVASLPGFFYPGYFERTELEDVIEHFLDELGPEFRENLASDLLEEADHAREKELVQWDHWHLPRYGPRPETANRALVVQETSRDSVRLAIQLSLTFGRGNCRILPDWDEPVAVRFRRFVDEVGGPMPAVLPIRYNPRPLRHNPPQAGITGAAQPDPVVRQEAASPQSDGTISLPLPRVSRSCTPSCAIM